MYKKTFGTEELDMTFEIDSLLYSKNYQIELNNIIDDLYCSFG